MKTDEQYIYEYGDLRGKLCKVLMATYGYSYQQEEVMNKILSVIHKTKNLNEILTLMDKIIKEAKK